jgi:peroxidase
MKEYDLYPLADGYTYKYDDKLYPQISNEFATAAMRLHSLIDNIVFNGTIYKNLTDLFYNQYETYNSGDAYGVAGLQGCTIFKDLKMSTAIRDSLFKDFPEGGDKTSLTAIDLQRSRDHGLQSYNVYRKFCGLKKAYSWDDLDNISEEKRAKLKSIYKSVHEIELIPGMAAENLVEGGLVGHTQACKYFYIHTNNFIFFSIITIKIRFHCKTIS